ncbi:hypothetical protein NKR23_g2114 [Pleurostoma richardsiae]|uniref:Uncharacterized protein n=1 Tax=Pleurostoma richardsiae TaxID=41990 RepID=A0AA38VJB0_9PEZI|nr:hypothetical protein NKR23_g2114 [Pleurostoma richardsiae]
MDARAIELLNDLQRYYDDIRDRLSSLVSVWDAVIDVYEAYEAEHKLPDGIDTAALLKILEILPRRADIGNPDEVDGLDTMNDRRVLKNEHYRDEIAKSDSEVSDDQDGEAAEEEPDEEEDAWSDDSEVTARPAGPVKPKDTIEYEDDPWGLGLNADPSAEEDSEDDEDSGTNDKDPETNDADGWDTTSGKPGLVTDGDEQDDTEETSSDIEDPETHDSKETNTTTGKGHAAKLSDEDTDSTYEAGKSENGDYYLLHKLGAIVNKYLREKSSGDPRPLRVVDFKIRRLRKQRDGEQSPKKFEIEVEVEELVESEQEDIAASKKRPKQRDTSGSTKQPKQRDISVSTKRPKQRDISASTKRHRSPTDPGSARDKTPVQEEDDEHGPKMFDLRSRTQTNRESMREIVGDDLGDKTDVLEGEGQKSPRRGRRRMFRSRGLPKSKTKDS